MKGRPGRKNAPGVFFQKRLQSSAPFCASMCRGTPFYCTAKPAGAPSFKTLRNQKRAHCFWFSASARGAALRAAGKAQAAQKRNPAKNIGGIARRGVCFRGNAFLRLRPPGRLIPHREKKGAARRRAGATQAVWNIVAPLFVILSHTPQRRYGIMCPPGGQSPIVLRHLPACITHLRRF